MDDPPIAFDFDQLDDDDIIAELALQQFQNTELDYVGSVAPNHGPCVVGEEDMQPYLDGHAALEGIQQGPEHDVWGFEILDLPVGVMCEYNQLLHSQSHLLQGDSSLMDVSNNGMLLNALAAPSESLVSIHQICEKRLTHQDCQQLFIPQLTGQIVNHEGSQDSMSDWTFASPAPSCITLAPLAPSHPSSSISDSFDSFDYFDSFTSYSGCPITTLGEFQGLLDVESPIASYDDRGTIGAQAAGYDAQDVAFGNDLVMVDKEQEHFQQKSGSVTGEFAVAGASRYLERSDLRNLQIDRRFRAPRIPELTTYAGNSPRTPLIPRALVPSRNRLAARRPAQIELKRGGKKGEEGRGRRRRKSKVAPASSATACSHGRPMPDATNLHATVATRSHAWFVVSLAVGPTPSSAI